MSLSALSIIDSFGTQDEVSVASPTQISDGSFSLDSDITEWSNSDNAPSAAFVLQCQFSSTPDDGSTINLYARRMDVQGVNNSPKPSAVNKDQFIGQFFIDGDLVVDTDSYLVTGWLQLNNHSSSQPYEFYIENLTGQTISSGWSLFTTPVTRGVK